MAGARGCCAGAGVLTKSVAGLFVLPGLLACLVFQRGVLRVAREPQLWLTGLAVLLVCSGYYASRELVDTGYLRDVWQNELGGRYATTDSQLHAGTLYYVIILLSRFEPGFILLPLTILPLLRQNPDRRNVALICLCSASSLLLAITTAATKAWWYAAPAVPLLSLAIGIGLADSLTLLQTARVRQRISVRPGFFKAILAAVFGVALIITFYWEKVAIVSYAEQPNNTQWWYGVFLDEL